MTENVTKNKEIYPVKVLQPYLNSQQKIINIKNPVLKEE
jgi:hypothetical protein